MPAAVITQEIPLQDEIRRIIRVADRYIETQYPGEASRARRGSASVQTHSESTGRRSSVARMGHSLTTPRLDRQPRLAAVERLDLALFVEREHHGVGRWIDAKPDNIGQLGGKARIARTLEGADAVGLQLVHLPALHRAQRDADRLGHGAASPMGRLVRRRGAGGHLVPQNSFGRWGALDNNAPSLTAQPSGESMLTRQNEARDPAAPAADSARLFK